MRLAKFGSLVRASLSQLSTVVVLGTLGTMFFLGPKIAWNPMRIPELLGAHPSAAEVPLTTAGEVAAAKAKAAESGSLDTISLKEDVADDVGLRAAEVRRMRLVQEIVVPGELNYDPYLTAEVSSRVPGVVWRVEKKVGEPVKKGEVLALIDSADVGEAKAKLLQSLVQVDLRTKIRKSLDEKVIPARSIIEAEANLREARVGVFNAEQMLRNLRLPIRNEDVVALIGLPEDQIARKMRFLGLPDSLVSEIESETATANLVPLVAPFDGIVIGRDLVVGESVGGDEKKYFTIADVSQMWVTLEVRQEDSSELVVGQTMEFVPDGDWDRLVEGRLSWISTEADERTRTLQVRAIVENQQGKLRANTYGTGRIHLSSSENALVVPNNAIQKEGAVSVVFIREIAPDGAQRFVRREVQIGIRTEDYTEILSGLDDSESVVTAGSFILRAEVTRRRQTVASL